MKLLALTLNLIAVLVTSVQARDIYVNPAGTNSADVATTIKRAMGLAGPGDTIHLDPGSSPYYEQAFFAQKSGTAEAPIILDGHGATIDGSIPLRPEEWEPVSDGLYKSTIIPSVYCFNANPAYVGRFYFLWDGTMNRMGRSIKNASSASYKLPSALAPGEWTYVAAEKAFYLKLPPGMPINNAPVRVPKIVSGVQIDGNCHNLTIRNITVTHVINDGFALTVNNTAQATVRNVRFENITAIECGDDGLSAHGDCEVFVDGFLSRANSTGYCSQGVSTNRHVRIEKIDGVEIFPIGGRHEFIDTIVVGNATRPVTVEAAAPFTSSELILKNCLIVSQPGRDPATALVRVASGCTLRAKRLTTQGVGFQISGAVRIESSVIAGGNGVSIYLLPGGEWRGICNIYDAGIFRLGTQVLGPAAFDTFQSQVGETGSTLQSIPPFEATVPPSPVPAGVGADYSKLH